MSIALTVLELRKNRLAAASAAAAFLVTLPVCRLVSAATGLELKLSLDAALTGWLLAGVPLAAALIGASSGSAAASRDAVETEGLLPLSPGRRALSAVAASILLTAAFAAFVLTIGAALGRGAGGFVSPEKGAWGAGFWHNLPLAPLLALTAFDVLAGAWVLSRLLGHGVAGGLLALLLTAASGAAVAGCFGLDLLHHEWGASCYASALALAWGGAACKLWAAALAARWSERRTGAKTLAAALALLLLPAAMIWGRLGTELRMLDTKVMAVGDESVQPRRRSFERFPRGSRALAAAGEGAVLKTLRGGLVLADARGVRTLVPERNGGLSDILREPFQTWIRGAWRDDNGVLWIDRYASPGSELWRIEGEKAEKKIMTDFGSFTMFAGVPLKHRYVGGRVVRVAAAEDYFRRGDKAAWYAGYKPFLAARRREARAARVSCGGKCLATDERRWTLPGIGETGDDYFPYDFGGRRAYVVAVRAGNDWKTVLCRDDGSTAVAWPGIGDPRTLPDGTLYDLAQDGTLRFVEPDGAIAPPVHADPDLLGADPALLRRSAGKAWLIARGRLTVLDAGGRAVRSNALPEGIEDAIPLKEGFVLTTARAAYFVDWSGTLRRLRNPR